MFLEKFDGITISLQTLKRRLADHRLNKLEVIYQMPIWLLRIDLVLRIAKHLEPDGNFTE